MSNTKSFSDIANNVGALSLKYPKTAEAIIAGGVTTGYDIYSGEFSGKKH